MTARVCLAAAMLVGSGVGLGCRKDRPAPPAEIVAVPAPLATDAAPAPPAVDAAPAIDGPPPPIFSNAAGVCDYDAKVDPDPTHWDVDAVTVGPIPSCGRPDADEIVARFAGVPGYRVTPMVHPEFGELYSVTYRGVELMRVQPVRNKYYFGIEIVSPLLMTDQNYEVGNKAKVGNTLREVLEAVQVNIECDQDPIAAGGLVRCEESGGPESPIAYKFRFAQPPDRPPIRCGTDTFDYDRCANLVLTSIVWNDLASNR